MVASDRLDAYWRKRSISLLIKDVGFACFEAISLIAVHIVGSTERAQNRKTPTISCSSSFSAGAIGETVSLGGLLAGIFRTVVAHKLWVSQR